MARATRKTNPQSRVKFTTGYRNGQIIKQIAERFVALHEHLNGAPLKARERSDLLQHTVMDISATHANGNPLRLESLLATDDFNLLHDVVGIHNHLDRSTGKLINHFRPRFTVRGTP